AAADYLLKLVNEIAPGLELKYNKIYIGLAADGQPNNFVIFRAKKNHINVEPRIEQSDDFRKELENAGLDLMEYDTRWGRYRIRVTPKEVKAHDEILRRVFKKAYEENGK